MLWILSLSLRTLSNLNFHTILFQQLLEGSLVLHLSSTEVPESLLRDKDEYEAYWEHYISVKEELVENILQVDIAI